MKIKQKINYDIYDFAVLMIIISTLSLHNFSKLLFIMQTLGSFIIILSHITTKKVLKTKISYIIWKLLIIFYGLFSVLWAINSKYVVSNAVSITQTLMVGIAIILYISSEEKKEKTLKFIRFSAIVLIIRMIIQVPISAWGTSRIGKYIGYNANGPANVLAYATIFTTYEYNKNKKKKDLIWLILFSLFSFLCGTKKAIIVIALGIAIQFIFSSKSPLMLIKRLIQISLVLIFIYYTILNVPMLYNTLGVRIERMFLALNGEIGGDMSTLDRMSFANNAIDIFKAHPIIGVGLDNFRFYNTLEYYAHNNYLELAADLGVIGVLMYYYFIIGILHKLIAFKQKNKEIYLLISFIIVLLITDLANVSYAIDSIQLYLAIVYGIFLLTIEKRKEDASTQNNTKNI